MTLCLHEWGAHGHPTLVSADRAAPGIGLILFFRVDDFVRRQRKAGFMTPIILILSMFAAPAVQAADGYGRVAFANSGAPAAQADFQAGMALLHDFEYPAAAAAFKRAQTADPSFAMAYWGEAMTHNHPIWMEQDLEAARAALSRLAPTAAERRAAAKTAREQDYFDAIEVLYGEGTKEDRDRRFEAAMARLHATYPDDIDATAFYGLAILGTAHGGRDIPTYMRAAGVMEQAWVAQQEHPGLLHYLIHSYDDPVHAPLGLRAARLYARIAPDAGHAQHMTSHIFLALGMWPETVDANIAAIAAVNRMRGTTTPGCGHYPSWLAYAYLQQDKIADARRVLDGCAARAAAMAGQAPARSMDPDTSAAGAFANMRLRHLIDTNDWTGAAAAATLPKNAGAGARLDFAFTDTLRAVARRDADGAGHALAALESAAREVVEIETRRTAEDPTSRERPAIFLLQARGLLAELNGDPVAAERFLRDAVTREHALPIAFGPPTIDKPSAELLGEFLLRHGKRAEAQQAFAEALARTPGRRLAETGLKAAR